jgi:predicted HTH transcriptional regulator
MAVTSAGQFFQDCVKAKDKKAFVQKLIAEKQTENDWLDFKRHPGTANEPKLRSMWFEAISGFANSGGGILFRGIECAKNAKGIDAADKIAPIKGLAAFETRMRELARNGTNPPPGNIE